MRKVSLCLLPALAQVALAQAPVPATSAYFNHVVELRCGCEDTRLEFDSSGRLIAGGKYLSLAPDAPRISLTRSAMKLFQPAKMNVSHGELRITGDRVAAAQGRADQSSPVDLQAEEEIDISQPGASSLEDFAPALAKVFSLVPDAAESPAKPNPACSPQSHRPAKDPVTGKPEPFVQPVLVKSSYPEYTDAARHNHISGSVRLGLSVTAEGLPTDVCVVSTPLGYGLDENAIDAVRQYRFRPATRGGQPADAQLTVEVVFKMY